MENRDKFIEYLFNFRSNYIDDRSIKLVFDYLISKSSYIDINILRMFAMSDTILFMKIIERIIDELISKFNITTWIYDKNNKLLKII